MKRSISDLTDSEFDVLVIGGGIQGACIAWDAVLRGLSVALVERGDFGQEASANSLKTVHGGLRYLQDVDLQVVRGMIRERMTFLRIAPHLVHPLPCLTPTYHKLMKSSLIMNVALTMNDLIGYDRNNLEDPEKFLSNGKLISRTECLQILPGLPDVGITGGAVWYDAQMYNSERLTLAFILSAARKGAVVCNYAEVLYLTRESNKIIGACVQDVLTDNEFRVKAKIVVNAAGVWMDGINASLDQNPGTSKFNQSLAMNIIVPEIIQGYAAGLRSWLVKDQGNDDKHRSRMLFVSPWRGFSMAGTFHTFYNEKPDSFEVNEQALQEMLDEVNSAYPDAKLELNKIQFIHHGFLPAKNNSNGKEVKLVRQGQIYDHLQEAGISGLISVMGVKYTSAREVAQKAVDRIFKHFGGEPSKCKSNSTRLLGGMIDRFDDYLSEINQHDGQYFSPALLDDLVRSYGSEYPMIREQILTRVPTEPLTIESKQVIEALVHYAVTHEMALKLSDFLLRRTGIGSVKRPSQSIIQTAALAMKRELGWSVQKLQIEIAELENRYPKLK